MSFDVIQEHKCVPKLAKLKQRSDKSALIFV